jgi:precorrin-2 dehydrogenase/sirohydrochlorin ferrochelatase
MLLEAGANIRVVAPILTPELQSLVESGRIEHARAEYNASHLTGARLVVAATNRQDVNELVVRDAQAQGALVNDAGDPSRGDFTVPAVVQRGDLILTATTVGGSPSLSKRIRDELASQYGPEWGPYVALLGEARRRALADIADDDRRKEALYRVAADSELLELIREGRTEEARTRAFACISPLSD